MTFLSILNFEILIYLRNYFKWIYFYFFYKMQIKKNINPGDSRETTPIWYSAQTTN